MDTATETLMETDGLERTMVIVSATKSARRVFPVPVEAEMVTGELSEAEPLQAIAKVRPVPVVGSPLASTVAKVTDTAAPTVGVALGVMLWTTIRVAGFAKSRAKLTQTHAEREWQTCAGQEKKTVENELQHKEARK